MPISTTLCSSSQSRIRNLLLTTLFVCSSCATGSVQGPIVSESQVPHHNEVIVKQLPGSINSKDDDFGLVRGADDRFTYFTSDRSSGKGRQDIYSGVVSLEALRTGAYQGFANTSDLNTSENEGCATFTPDGNTMIFAAAGRDDAVGSTDLYQADRIDGRWQNVRILAGLSSSEWDSHPSLSTDGKTLYFVSDRDGGFGGQDIYVASRTGNNWSAPQNLGPIINSAGDEASPYIAADGTTLYFSSTGRPGLGGYDVYLTHNIGGVWSAPVNAGIPINSSANDLFFSAQLGSQHAWVASDREGTLGGLDEYAVEPNPFVSGGVTIVSGIVRDAVTHTPLGAAITITNLQSGESVATFRSDDQSGNYLVVLQPGQTYSVTAEAPGYLFYSDRYTVDTTRDVSLGGHIIDLSPAASGKTRLLVFFDFNSSTLNRESSSDLDRAVRLLTDSPTMYVTLAGYTDSIGSAESNLTLSQSRANSVKDYLVRHGIAASRVAAIGHGESDPVADNGTDEGRARNRRVEFQVSHN